MNELREPARPRTGLVEFEREGTQNYTQAFKSLHAHAHRSAARVVGEGDEAQEIAQETLTRALQSWHRVGETPWTRAWVKRVSRNLAIDSLRRRHRESESVPGFETDDATANVLGGGSLGAEGVCRAQ